MVKSTSCITIDFMNMSQLTERTFTPSESLSSLSLFLSLARGQCRPGKFWHRRSFRQKFLLRSLIMPRLSVEWMNELSHWPNLNVLLTRQPRLPVRLHRPYLAANLSRKQLLEALRYGEFCSAVPALCFYLCKYPPISQYIPKLNTIYMRQ